MGRSSTDRRPQKTSSTEYFHLEGLGAIACFAHFKADAIILSQTEESVVGYVGTVEKDFFLIFVDDKSVIFLFIEPFNGAFQHKYLSISMMVRMRLI